MSTTPQVPVIVGIGEVVNRSLAIEDAAEPLHLILQAIQNAIADAHTVSDSQLRESIDSVDVVACWTWPYDNLPGLIAKSLEITPPHQFMPNFHGGNQPAQLLDQAARRISQGQTDVAVICGGEALASLGAYAKAGQLPPPTWTSIADKVDSVFSPSTRDLTTGIGKPHRIGAPIHIYPLYENGFRAHRRQSIVENNRESAGLYGSFARVADGNPFAWNYGKRVQTAASIGTVSDANRMICFPYPLLMNAFNNVNLAAACLLTSTTRARDLGIPEDRWVYPLGGAGTRDSYDFWERPNYHTSPSISRSLDACLKISGLGKDDIDAFDIYSCFPIVPKIACQHLGISIVKPKKPVTVLGGLTSFGGAGNNYSMHAITEMTRRIRDGRVGHGLVLANGGCLTYQYAVCLSSKPRKNDDAYPTQNPLSEVIDDLKIPAIELEPEGEAEIETYTVEFDRSGKPVRGHIVGRMGQTNHRFIANHADDWTLQQLSSQDEEPIGRLGVVQKDREHPGRNLFHLRRHSRL